MGMASMYALIGLSVIITSVVAHEYRHVGRKYPSRLGLIVFVSVIMIFEALFYATSRAIFRRFSIDDCKRRAMIKVSPIILVAEIALCLTITSGMWGAVGTISVLLIVFLACVIVRMNSIASNNRHDSADDKVHQPPRSVKGRRFESGATDGEWIVDTVVDERRNPAQGIAPIITGRASNPSAKEEEETV